MTDRAVSYDLAILEMKGGLLFHALAQATTNAAALACSSWPRRAAVSVCADREIPSSLPLGPGSRGPAAAPSGPTLIIEAIIIKRPRQLGTKSRVFLLLRAAPFS